ncbi:MAG: GntR family transcriptional regulator [Hyphomicrobiales bacterium]|nr:GntR family transcriptional regulator [Hyphomicrobiales bacterium]
MAKNPVSISPLLFVLLDSKLSDPLQLQFYYQIKDAVLARRLKPGTRLPATRALAIQLSVSRNTVPAAFGLLRSEDYIESNPGSDTQITNRLSEDLLLKQAKLNIPFTNPVMA